MEERKELKDLNDLGYVAGEKSKTSYLSNISNMHFNFESPNFYAFKDHIIKKYHEDHPNAQSFNYLLDAVTNMYVCKKK